MLAPFPRGAPSFGLVPRTASGAPTLSATQITQGPNLASVISAGEVGATAWPRPAPGVARRARVVRPRRPPHRRGAWRRHWLGTARGEATLELTAQAALGRSKGPAATRVMRSGRTPRDGRRPGVQNRNTPHRTHESAGQHAQLAAPRSDRPAPRRRHVSKADILDAVQHEPDGGRPYWVRPSGVHGRSFSAETPGRPGNGHCCS